MFIQETCESPSEYGYVAGSCTKKGKSDSIVLIVVPAGRGTVEISKMVRRDHCGYNHEAVFHVKKVKDTKQP